MQTSIKQRIMAVKIELHWYRIKILRRKMGKLVETGAPYSYPPLVKLSEKVYRHIGNVRALQSEYEKTTLHLFTPVATH